jgi:Ca-activated chloride channel family protein
LNLRDWWPQDTALTFAHPWLLLLLLALPLIAYLRGQRGRAAALIFSSTTVLRGLGKASASRTGKFLRRWCS